ncbi:hypothetical protein Taro_044715 [Colocasia esculenta]|uniref:LOB domain-containing protein n=1 Tax=Colocasia esculenta TaxID=4460 RepID=A0A843WV93_COLES|nr:hypothetical protein [Colocasia esculenta]
MSGYGSRSTGVGGLPEEVGDLPGSAGGVQLAAVDGFGGNGGVVRPCGACKFLRRKCVAGCVFSPYFHTEEGASYFAAMHKVFGAGNVSKLLVQIPDDKRFDAVVTICYEAQARIRDGVYGCTSQIIALQQQLRRKKDDQPSVNLTLDIPCSVAKLQSEVAYLQAQIAELELLSPPPPPPPPPHTTLLPLPPSPPPFSVFDIPPPSPSTLSTTVDLASIFFSTPEQLPWPMHQQEEQPQQLSRQQQEQHILMELQQLVDGTGDGSSFTLQNALDIRDFQALANDLIEKPIHPPPSMSK